MYYPGMTKEQTVLTLIIIITLQNYTQHLIDLKAHLIYT